MDLKKFIAKIPNYPKPGITFLDVTPLLLDGEAFKNAVEKIAAWAKSQGATKIVGPEARGFLIGAPVASYLNLGFAPVRKPNKLPRAVVSEDYDLEYGKDTLCMHADSITKGDKVVIVDDLLATGGTVKAVCNLIEKLGGEVVGIACLIELTDLPGREVLKGYHLFSLMEFTEEI